MSYFKSLILFCSVILVVLPTKVVACSCSEITALEMLDSEFNKHIFTGIVTSAQLVELDGVYYRVQAEVKVEEQFKGLAEQEYFSVLVHLQSSLCGGSISVGDSYIFIANEGNEINFCTSKKIGHSNMDWNTRVYLDELRNFANKKIIDE
jgi:hypothetical protein